MTHDARKVPSHELTYVRLRDMVLFGTLAPGQPVTIQGLISDLGAGMTPVREAIRRLTAEGVPVEGENVDLQAYGFDEFLGDRPLQRLRRLQEDLVSRVSLRADRKMPALVAGVDVSYPAPGEGVAKLRHSFALIIGLWQMSAASGCGARTDLTVVKRGDAVPAAFVWSFPDELRRALNGMWQSVTAESKAPARR